MTPSELRAAWPAIERRLQTADILLFHTRTGALSRMIQKNTESYWNHSALIFLPKRGFPLGGPLIVEASYGGVEIHQMKKYADFFDTYDIGVLRYPGMKQEDRQQLVMNFILNNIDVSYDFSRLFGLFLRPLLLLSPRLFEWATGKLIHKQNFICSTFVHHAFRDFHAHGAITLLSSVTRPGHKPLPFDEMIAPGHLALEHHFTWIFNKQA